MSSAPVGKSVIVASSAVALGGAANVAAGARGLLDALMSTGSGDGEKINQTYGSIKDAPEYPAGFRAAQNGTVKNNVKNGEVLEKLREVEPGDWQKVYLLGDRCEQERRAQGSTSATPAPASDEIGPW